MSKLVGKLSYLFIAILLIYVSTLSAIVPWTGDDITYLFSFSDGQVISSLQDAWNSQIVHWHQVNGRFTAHFLVQIFIALIGRTGFVAVNACAYLALIALILKLTGRDIRDWKSTLAVCVLVLLALPTKFVPTCQIGYIWMFDIVLFFIHQWNKIVVQKQDVSKWNLLWLIPLAFFAGLSNEAIVIGVSVALIIYSLKHIKNLGLYGWVLPIAFGIGAMLMCFSPANFGRTAEEHSAIGGLSEMTMGFVKFFLYQRVSYILVLFVIYLMVVKKIKFLDIYKSSSFFWNAWFTLVLFNVAIGVFGNRQLFGAELMAVILVLQLLSSFLPNGNKLPQTVITSLVVLLMVFNTYSAVRAKELYEEIVSEYETSSDGSVNCKLGFFDRHYRESGPSDAWSWYVTSTVDKYLHLNGAPKEKTLTLVSE